MTGLDDRKKAFENQFAHDAELQFKVEARACKLFGLWLAEEMGMEGAEADAYAAKIVEANLDEPGFEDVLRAIRPDIAAKQLNFSDEALLAQLESLIAVAKRQFMEQ
jgi:hypothetical protein